MLSMVCSIKTFIFHSTRPLNIPSSGDEMGIIGCTLYLRVLKRLTKIAVTAMHADIRISTGETLDVRVKYSSV